MHEVRVSLPPASISEEVRLAHAVGIDPVSISDVFVHGPSEPAKVLSVEKSTPKARAFIEIFLSSSTLSTVPSTLTSRELRAVVSHGAPADLTNPISRAAAGAILLASGMIHNEPIAIVVAALFLPFLSQVLAVSFGVWSSGVAGAVQFAVFPVWFGLSLVIGMPSGEVIWSRLLRFSINLLTICISGALAYATLHATP